MRSTERNDLEKRINRVLASLAEFNIKPHCIRLSRYNRRLLRYYADYKGIPLYMSLLVDDFVIEAGDKEQWQ